MKTRWTLKVIVLLLTLSINSILAGIGDYKRDKIFSSDGVNYATFGTNGAVAIDGDYAVVGSYLDDANGISNSGSAYIFYWNGSVWTEQAKLTASDGNIDYQFGKKVAISGDRVIVSSVGTYSTNIKGRVYVFKRNGNAWTEESILMASDGSARDLFGADLAILNDEIIVTATDINLYKGAAYFFKYENNNWTEKQIFTPTSTTEFKQFGESIAIDENSILVGSPSDSYGGYSTHGSAYIFIKEGDLWIEKKRLIPNDSLARKSFGTSVALNNGVAIIGDVNTTPEKVYIFGKINESTWTQLDTIKSGFDNSTLFGYDLAVDNDYILLGCKNNSEIAYKSGAVYVYKKIGNQWSFDEKIFHPDSEWSGEFGSGVACKNGRYIIGANYTAGKNPESGAAFIYMQAQVTPGMITSTISGGNWDATTTWIGGVVPTETDNVVIDGEVVVNNSTAKCFNLTINSGKTLTKDNDWRKLSVIGNLTNNGVITENNYSTFDIEITGNVINNGTWERGNLIFSGTNDNKIMMSADNTINNSTISKLDPNSFLVIGSNGKFDNCIFSNFGTAQVYYQLKIEEGTNYILDLMKTSTLKSVNFNGSGSILKDAILQRDWSGKILLENVNLKGTVVVSSDSIVFSGNNVIVEDTLTKDNDWRKLSVIGDLTNNGVITENNYSTFDIEITGNVINNGTWERGNLIFSGTNDNKIMMSADNTINNSTISKLDPNSFLVIGSNGKFDNCIFSNFGTAQVYYQLKIEEGTNYILDLMKTSTLKSVNFNGSGSILKDAILQRDGSGKVLLENVHLKGIAVVSSDSIVFSGNNVIVEDTLTKDNDWRKLSVIGNLTNNGVITENNYSTFDIEITGNIINNGIWEYCWAIMNGKVDQTINNTNSFTGNVRLTANVSSSSTYQWYKNATAISGATSDMYEILTFQEENNGLYYCQTDAGNSRTITIVRNSPYGEEILTENFDGTQFPPNGWTQSTLNSSKTWMQGNSISHLFGEIDATNVYSAICPWVAQPQNEWLKTPIVSFPNDAISLEFYAGFSTSYLLNATMKLNLSTDGGSNWTKIWEANNDGNDWQWRKVTLDLSSYTNNSNVMLAWQYVGNDGDLMGIDNVKLMHGPVDVKDNSAEIPTEYVLTQNYPNPFNPTTKISYSIPSNSNVTIKIFDALGRIVATLVNAEKTAGKYTVEFNGSNLSSGVYFYRLKAENFVDTKKLMLLK